jgi:hypothetical protein
MDRLRIWRPRRPVGGARSAEVTALVLLTLTAGLAVLLAVLSHQAWPPVLVSILLGVPALYVAWLAVPIRNGDTPNASPGSRGWFSSPRNGSEVGHQEEVSGAVANLLPMLRRGSFVRPTFEGTYWPQCPLAVDQAGNFQAEARFGRKGGEDITGKYVLLLVMALPNASARLRGIPR